MNIRGIRRTFYPPAQQTQIDNSPPEKKLQLKWVHGYRGRDTHKNLWVLPSGEMLYYVAAVAVLYDRDEETQRHYTGHTEDIMRLVNCLPCHQRHNDKKHFRHFPFRVCVCVQHGHSSVT